MRKLLVILMFLSVLFVGKESSAVNGKYCSPMLDWAPYGCDEIYNQCAATCGSYADCQLNYDQCIAACEGDTDCEVACDEDFMYCEDEVMYCEDDCMYASIDCEMYAVHNGYVVGNGAVVEPDANGTFNFNLSCDNGGIFIANAQVGYQYYSLYVQNTENYCYEYPWEGRMICGHGTGMVNGQPVNVSWCINIDYNTIHASIDGVTICEEIDYGYIHPVIWTSPMFFDGYFDGFVR